MIKVYSKVDPEKLLHFVVRKEEFIDGRIDLVDKENFIQCSALKLNKGHTFKTHKHIWKYKEQYVIAQESWVVISGKVQCSFYDTDNKHLWTEILNPGDVSFTLEGGHNYLILEDNTLVYEMKTGPYEGQINDKVFI